tara:strand:+ start:628 stop:1545 length:918 start_codon:yes stop_codon:yes gene_type:complete
MKRLLLSLALSTASLLISQSAFAGPGESDGNTANDCNTASGSCPVTPTKFSAKLYRVALCTSNPMADRQALDWTAAGCVDVYNSSDGEETGDIFSSTGATLSAANITVPSAGTFEYVAALFDKDFKVGSHHMVYAAAGDPVNNKRYVSTSTGGSIEGTASDVQMRSGNFDSFMPQIECSGTWSTAATVTRSSTTAGIIGDFLSGGETFFGRILNSSYEVPSTGGGSISSDPPSGNCTGARYLLSIVDKTTEITSTTKGLHLKILAGKGLIRADQGDESDESYVAGVVTQFTAHGDGMAVKVVPIQ